MHENMRFMYFLHLVPTFPLDIVVEKGLLHDCAASLVHAVATVERDSHTQVYF